ncbi:hypothetical protein AB0D27_28010 [Streptomyces sp. NPDC048415]|uniref:hypothetical protein n=1 Tax=Streptomyces sp. NPDC048415 TaxID=3154822 RepID=UPI00343655BB
MAKINGDSSAASWAPGCEGRAPCSASSALTIRRIGPISVSRSVPVGASRRLVGRATVGRLVSRRLIGRVADGRLPSATRVPPAELASGQRIVDEAAAAAGRDPRSIRRRSNLTGLAPAGQLAEPTLTQGASACLLASDDASTLARFAHEVPA